MKLVEVAIYTWTRSVSLTLRYFTDIGFCTIIFYIAKQSLCALRDHNCISISRWFVRLPFGDGQRLSTNPKPCFSLILQTYVPFTHSHKIETLNRVIYECPFFFCFNGDQVTSFVFATILIFSPRLTSFGKQVT